ncbi:MAG: hypothetical protein ACRDQU_11220 [Pseudonocardiaceae bacterium]
MTSDASDAAEPCRIVAFTSPGGTGRTAVLVNVACVLAAAGKRVLLLDQGAEAPRVDDYLVQFQTDMVRAEHPLAEDLVLALWGTAADRDDPTVYRYRLPINSVDIDAVEFPRSSTASQRGPGQDAALRNRICAAGYDYVLSDIAPSPAPATIRGLAYLCDTVVVCFHPRASDVAKAAAMAGAIAELVPLQLAILAVTVQFDDQDPDLARRTKHRIQTAFADLATAAVSATIAEIPYRPVGVVFDQAVAMLHDEPGAPIPAAYARITDMITAGKVDRMRPVPAHVRDSYRYSLGVSSLSAQPRIFLAYAAEDRLWADWIQNLLESSGAKVGRLSAGEPWLEGPGRATVLVVGSPRLARSPTGSLAIDLIQRSAGMPGVTVQFDVLVVQVPGPPHQRATRRPAPDQLRGLRRGIGPAETVATFRAVLPIRHGHRRASGVLPRAPTVAALQIESAAAQPTVRRARRHLGAHAGPLPH